MTLNKLARRLEKYIRSTGEVVNEVKLKPPEDLELRKRVEEVLALARQYYLDSLYYRGRGDQVSSLVCVVYSEGLLDALRILGWADFNWPSG